MIMPMQHPQDGSWPASLFSSIPPLAYVFFALCLLATCVELFFAYLENERGRKIAKCFCVGFLVAMAIAWKSQAWPIYLGATFGVIGDFFLLKKHKVLPIVLGTTSFLIGHVFYIIAYCLLCSFSWWVYVALAVFYALFCLIGYHIIHKFIKEPHLAFGGIVYFGMLVLDLLFAIFACFYGKFECVFMCVLGGVCFVISDCFLVRTSFVKDVKRRDFFIMATYMMAQILIIVGLCFSW
jgi:uncharacterized membrane protein YhhN